MFTVALLMSAVIALGGARTYERCELARDLMQLGVDKEHVATWVCIAFHESRFDTAARNPHSGDHGLLQISELYWCGPGKACGVPCSAFRDEDISDDVQCALRIHEEHTRLQGDGFLAWVVYPHHCRHNAKKYIIDCDTSVKSSSTKIENRARSLKSSVRNTTTPQFPIRRDIDELQPPYLAIKQLLKGNYVNEFEKNYYSNKTPLNWVNFKINNIDELRLPNLNNNRNIVFSTPSTVTTTIDPELIGIKPPSPRKIESNQFRRRNMNLEILTTKTNGKSDYTPRKINIEYYTSPTTQQRYLDLSHNPFLMLKTISTQAPYTPRDVSSYYKNSFTATSPKPATARLIIAERKVSVSNQNVDLFTTPKSVTSRRGKARYVPELSDFGIYKTTQRPSRTRLNVSRIETNLNNNQIIFMNESKVGEKNITIETTTLKSITSYNINQTLSTEAVQVTTSSSPKYNEAIPLSVTSRPTTWSFSRLTLNKASDIQSTTHRPWAIESTTAQITTSSTTTSPPTKTVVSSAEFTPTSLRTVSSEATTEKSTQSLFDLYLRPTRATIRPYKFSSFQNSPFKLRIFSGGTTMLPPSYISSKRL